MARRGDIARRPLALAIKPRFDSFPTEALFSQSVGMDKQAKRHGFPRHDPAQMAWAVQKSYRRCVTPEQKMFSSYSSISIAGLAWCIKGTHADQSNLCQSNSNPSSKRMSIDRGSDTSAREYICSILNLAQESS